MTADDRRQGNTSRGLVVCLAPGSRRARKTLEREKARKVAAALSEYAKNAPPIDFKASLDSLEIMEGVMRHFYLRALIERSVGEGTNWDKVDALMLKTLAAAEKVARYKHAQLSAVRVAGDISGKMDDVSLDELLVTIRQEWAKLGPLIDLEAVQAGVENRGGLTLGRRRIEHGLRSRA
jgi:hypothetical protein